MQPDVPKLNVQSYFTTWTMQERYSIAALLVLFSYGQTHGAKLNGLQVEARFTTDSVFHNTTQIVGFTKEHAKELCKNTILNNTVFSTCKEIIESDTISEFIENCVFDVTVTGDGSWAAGYVQLVASICINTIKMNPELWAENGTIDSDSVFEEKFINNLCALDCGRFGKCYLMSCKCDPGYGGQTCLVGPAAAPAVIPDIMVCDPLVMECNDIFIRGFNFTNNDNLLCKIDYISIAGDFQSTRNADFTSEKALMEYSQQEVREISEPQEIISVSEVQAQFSGYSQVYCLLPEVHSAKIYIANNKYFTSTSYYLLVVFNSTCQNCTLLEDSSSKNISCDVLDNYCVIENQCVEHGFNSSNSSCDFCDSTLTQITWSRRTAPECQPPQEQINLLIIIVPVVAGMFVAMLISTLYFLIKRKSRKQVDLTASFCADQGQVTLTHF